MTNLVGNRIRQVREEKEIDQDSLGAAIGRGRTAIANYESGARVIGTDQLKNVAKHLEMDPLELLELRCQEAISNIIQEFKRSK